MPVRQLIARPATDTPAELRSSAGPARALPEDLASPGVPAAGDLALIAAALWTVGVLLAAGFTPGTPAYMAPEMALAETVDAHADLYALGCVAYFLLTGRQIFDATTPYQMIAKHLHEEPALACLAKRP